VFIAENEKKNQVTIKMQVQCQPKAASVVE